MKVEKTQEIELTGQNFRIIDLGTNIDIPQIRETGHKDYVSWGPTNTFPQFLVDVYHTRSITHKTIINRKAKMIGSQGWVLPTDPSSLSFYKNVFNEDNLDDVLYKLTYDLELFNGFALGVRWNQTKERIAEVYHIPFETIRVDKNNGREGLPDWYHISDDWGDRRMKPKKVQGFSTKYKDNYNQILYCQEYQPGHGMWYPIANYYSSMNWILSEWEISNFHRSTIQNGFNAGFLLNFATGVPTPDEMERAYKQIQEKYTGTFNAGKFILTWSNGIEQAPKLEPIPLADTDARYNQLNDLIKNSIYTASEVTNPELLGVSVPGKLGGKAEMLEGLEIFQSVYVTPKQKFIEGKINKLVEINGGQPLKIKKYELDLAKIGQEQ